MWEKIRVVFTIPELRQKILLDAWGCWRSIASAGGFRCRSSIQQAMTALVARARQHGWATCCPQVAMFSATQLGSGHDLRPGHHALHFGLDYFPACWAAFGRRWNSCRRKAKAAARKSTNTPAMPRSCSASGKAGVYVSYMVSMGWIDRSFIDPTTHDMHVSGWHFTAVLTMTAGTIFLMWLGEQIDEFGIGNGISLLIMAGILARMPGASAATAASNDRCELGGGGGKTGRRKNGSCWRCLFVGVIAGVVFITHRAAAHSHAKRQARSRPPRVRRHAAVLCRCGSIRPASCRSSSPAAC